MERVGPSRRMLSDLGFLGADPDGRMQTHLVCLGLSSKESHADACDSCTPPAPDQKMSRQARLREKHFGGRAGSFASSRYAGLAQDFVPHCCASGTQLESNHSKSHKNTSATS